MTDVPPEKFYSMYFTAAEIEALLEGGEYIVRFYSTREAATSALQKLQDVQRGITK